MFPVKNFGILTVAKKGDEIMVAGELRNIAGTLLDDYTIFMK